MKKTIFEFKTYKAYLGHKTEKQSGSWGVKSKLATAINCQSAYLSQVMNGNADLSLEQSLKVCDYFNFSDDEKKFFLLLVQKDRAGTADLKKYFTEQIDEILSKRLVVMERLGAANKLSDEDKTTYYSAWYFSAIHMALSVPDLRTKNALKDFFNLSAQRVNQAIDFLLSVGLVQQKGDSYSMGGASIRLGNDTSLILRHHANWRTQALESLERELMTDLHYSGVFTLSKSDVLKIKDIMLEQLKSNLEIVRESKEEEVYVMNLDFFSLHKQV